MTNLYCPGCKESLVVMADHLHCEACDSDYPLAGGVACFSRTDRSFGEYSESEMEEFVAFAKSNGWRNALDEYAKGQRGFVKDLVLDEHRGNYTELLDLDGTERVLDLGCGFGGVSLQLAKQVKEVYALDASFHRVSFLAVVARQDKIANIYPVCDSDVSRLPFPDGYFDVISLVGVFEYIPLSFPDHSVREAHGMFLRELNRVLKPGGVLYLGTKNRYGWHYLAGLRDHNGVRFGPVLPRPVANAYTRITRNKPYRIVVYSYREYGELLTQAGFDGLQFYWPYPGYQNPISITPLDQTAPIGDKQLKEILGAGLKQRVLSLLSKLGLLRYFVPHYSILAIKR